MSTCEAGRNAGTPKSTRRPPFIFLTAFPVTVSPTLFSVMTRSQFLILSALRLLRRITPELVSIVSRSTSTSPPTFASSSLNSLRGT